MTIRTKLAAIATAALAVGTMVALSAPASAAVTASCSTVTTVNQFQAIGSCIIGDKKFTFVDSDLNLSPPVTDFNILFANAGLTYSFNGLTPLVGTGDPLADNEFIAYTIEVLDPTKQIVQVGLDANVTPSGGAGDTVVTKSIFDDIGGTLLDTLTSIDGAPDSSIALAHQLLYIVDNISLALNDLLIGFNNSFVQEDKPVPAPASAALFGLGLLGLAALRRRKAA